MKTVTYADILKMYQAQADLFLCHALYDVSDGCFDSREFLRVLGTDAYGPKLGKLVYRLTKFFRNPVTLESMYPGLGLVLNLPEPSKEVKAANAVRRTFRIAVLEALAKKCPERTFPFPAYL